MLVIYTDAKKTGSGGFGTGRLFRKSKKRLETGRSDNGDRFDDNSRRYPYMIATKIKEGNEELQVRDKEGYPIWMGWKTVK